MVSTSSPLSIGQARISFSSPLRMATSSEIVCPRLWPVKPILRNVTHLTEFALDMRYISTSIMHTDWSVLAGDGLPLTANEHLVCNGDGRLTGIGATNGNSGIQPSSAWYAWQ